MPRPADTAGGPAAAQRFTSSRSSLAMATSLGSGVESPGARSFSAWRVSRMRGWATFSAVVSSSAAWASSWG